MKGTVKFFNDSKGFGFISGEDGKEYFVHTTGLNEGVRIGENDAVTFDVVEGERGPKAENVSKDDGSEAPAEEAAPAEEPAEEDSEDFGEDESSEDSEDASEDEEDKE